MKNAKLFTVSEVQEHFTTKNINRLWDNVVKCNPDLLGLVWETNYGAVGSIKRQMTGMCEDVTHNRFVEGLVSSLFLMGEETTQCLLNKYKDGYMFGCFDLRPRVFAEMKKCNLVDLHGLLISCAIQGIDKYNNFVSMLKQQRVCCSDEFEEYGIFGFDYTKPKIAVFNYQHLH